jgi:omega-amidase
MRIALLQLLVAADKQANIRKACHYIKKAKDSGAKLIVLPECFNSPYGIEYFNSYAEDIPGPTTKDISNSAKENSVWIVAGYPLNLCYRKHPGEG